MGIRNYLSGLLPGWFGNKATTDLLADEPGRSRGSRVTGVKEYDDPLYYKIDRDCFKTIRTAYSTVQAQRKHASRIASRLLKVICPSDPAFALQVQEKCINKIPNLEQMHRWLMWGEIEGYRVNVLRFFNNDGWIIPDPTRGGRMRYNAGGNVEWDGTNVYHVEEWNGFFESEEERKEATLPRWRCIVHASGHTANVNGDSDLQRAFYSNAKECMENRKAIQLYRERFGNAKEMLFEELGELTAAQANTKLSAAAQKLERAGRRPLAMDKESIYKIAEPSGATWQFLLEDRREIRSEASMLVVQNAMSSAPANTDGQMRGNAKEAKTDEAIAADLSSKALANTYCVDLKRAIEHVNPGYFFKAPTWYLELQESEVEGEATAGEMLSFAQTGLPIKSDDLYRSQHAEKPKGTPDVIVLNLPPKYPSEPPPFGGEFPPPESGMPPMPVEPSGPATAPAPVDGKEEEKKKKEYGFEEDVKKKAAQLVANTLLQKLGWITISSDGDEDGVHVFVDSGGEITKGPNAIEGKSIKEVVKGGDQKNPAGEVGKPGTVQPGDKQSPAQEVAKTETGKPVASPTAPAPATTVTGTPQSKITKHPKTAAIHEKTLAMKPTKDIYEWKSKMSSAERESIDNWTGHEYSSINEAVLGKGKDSPWADKMAGNLATAIAKSPHYEGTVYRGVNLPDAKLKELLGADTIELQGFASSSKRGDIADSFAAKKSFGNKKPALLFIKSKTAADISSMSKYPKEAEVLLRPGSKYKVGEKKRAKDGRWLIHLEEIPHTSAVSAKLRSYLATKPKPGEKKPDAEEPIEGGDEGDRLDRFVGGDDDFIVIPKEGEETADETETPDEQPSEEQPEGESDSKVSKKPVQLRTACPSCGQVHANLAEAKPATNEIENLVSLAQSELNKEFGRMLISIADQVLRNVLEPKAPRSTAMALAKVRALADLAGRLRFRKQAGAVGVRQRKLATKVEVSFESSVNLPFDDAIRSFAKKHAVVAKTAEKVAKAYREGQFAAIKLVNQKMTENVKQKLLEYLEGGKPRESFISYLTEQDPEKITEAYADLVFRNNVSAAYSEGQRQEFNDLREEFGGWQFVTAGDESVRPTHAMLDGKIFPNEGYDHLMPPLDHNCRCTWVPVDTDVDPLSAKQITALASRAQGEDENAWEFSKTKRKKYGE